MKIIGRGLLLLLAFAPIAAGVVVSLDDAPTPRGFLELEGLQPLELATTEPCATFRARSSMGALVSGEVCCREGEPCSRR